ncbi:MULTISPECIES: type III CRISPR-associated RAMP protein Csx7 [Bacillus cereus group]|uniref:type III CRISPR-associated RAMP protein Csx7 n=1 Tax=Bacillus cereus group TaxID=86661 RepID=UPI001EEEE9ED|nr:CRISPR-associated RAMP protein Csx7 [Bacillus cereus]MDA1521467.1 CRISPR-associated RAMP protein Csx7 [Bacillus cereus]BCC09539.1 hypothetical protein BCM0060_p2205 [Bacillus cereus]BCC16528.1 hypothetical protein BCM0075_1298 [Bacillus cereus]BCC50565.1 hypothetical protein BCJMU02_p2159 [Bacillus cereus]BCD08722.1 hypothetical protein BC30052_p2004 [Bacillus cereus]
MNKEMGFAKLENTIKITVDLQLDTPLHIGGGKMEALEAELENIRIDKILRSDKGPYIPGSTLKGILRTASERLLHLVDNKEACFLENGGCTKKYYEHFSGLLKDKDKLESEKYSEIYSEICPVCQTYGSGFIASKIKVNPVFLSDEVSVRNGIKIDRDTGAVEPKALYNYECLNAGQTFSIVIEGQNLTDSNKEVLMLALMQLQQNTVQIGGKQTKGLGMLSYKGGTVEELTYDAANRQAVLAQLLNMEKEKESRIEKLEDYMKEILLKQGENKG